MRCSWREIVPALVLLMALVACTQSQLYSKRRYRPGRWVLHYDPLTPWHHAWPLTLDPDIWPLTPDPWPDFLQRLSCVYTFLLHELFHKFILYAVQCEWSVNHIFLSTFFSPSFQCLIRLWWNCAIYIDCSTIGRSGNQRLSNRKCDWHCILGRRPITQKQMHTLARRKQDRTKQRFSYKYMYLRLIIHPLNHYARVYSGILRSKNKFSLTASRPKQSSTLRYGGKYTAGRRVYRHGNADALKAGKEGSYDYKDQFNAILPDKALGEFMLPPRHPHFLSFGTLVNVMYDSAFLSINAM